MNARVAVAAVVLALTAGLTACGSSTGGGEPAASASASATASATGTPEASRTPTPTPTTRAIALPTDCRAILSESVLARLDGIPLNDAAFGPSGVGPEGTLTCNWADPRADTTRLTTTISAMNRGPALDMLNALAEGFSCFTPDEGTRCEKTWPNAQYPVTDGRTLFWREDVLIDTRYTNLAPSGYTSAIVEALFD